MNDGEENPVASGLIALVAVAVVVGLLAAIAALAGTRVIGLGGGESGSGNEPGAGQSLYLPDPVPTQAATGPLVTLVPTETASATATATASETPTETETASEARLVLQASPGTVTDGEQLMLSGTYVGGEGSVLDIWYNVGGAGWEEFPLDAYVSGSIFQTYVQTWKTGRIQWRVEDASAKLESNEVIVQHG